MMGAAYTTPALDVGEYPYFCMVHPWMEGLVIVTDDHSTTTSQPEPEPEPEPEPTPATTSSEKNYDSSTGRNHAFIENAMGSSTPGCEPDCFIPSTVTIPDGGTVSFKNSDSAAHTTTSGSPTDGPSGFWDSSMMLLGDKFQTPALSEGVYPYF